MSDYLRIAPRYGTNDDMVELVAQAQERGIRVLLDLVAGHTSVEHPWFQGELHAEGPDPEGDRYVWCEEPPAATGPATSRARRPGCGRRVRDRAGTSRTSTTSSLR